MKKLEAPKLWRDLSRITVKTLESPWYRHLAQLEHTISCETYVFFRERGLITLHLPVTTGTISSPMGRGSDSLPVQVNLFGVDTYLADSMQFMLEYGCRLHGQGCFYIMPSFRGEQADERHLCQFYHSEAEIPGTLEDVISLAEEYLRHLSKALLRDNGEDIAAFAGDTRHIEDMLQRDSFPRVTVDEAVRLFDARSPESGLYTTDPEYGFRSVTREGERFLMEAFGGFVWLTHFDHLSVPFYQAFDASGQKALNADLLFGIGEVVGSGQRHADRKQLGEALELHGVAPREYGWYAEMKEEKPLLTSGFGMGVERFLLWVIRHDDIRDCQILPRFNGVDCQP